jgi:hypothetical protein
MATNQSTSRVRSSRNRAKAAASGAPADTDSYSAPIASATIEGAIETERARLMMTAEAILHCVVIAMDESDGDNTHDPHSQSVIELARALVVQTTNQLDSVRLRPMLDKVGAHGKFGVKESAVEYVH